MSIQTDLLKTIHEAWGAGGVTINQLMSYRNAALQELIRFEYTKFDVKKWLDKKCGQLTKDWRVVKMSRDRYKVVHEHDKPLIERRGTAAEWVVVDKLSDAPSGMTARWLLDQLTVKEQRKVFGKRASTASVVQWLGRRRCVWLRYGRSWWRIDWRQSLPVRYFVIHTAEYPI